MKRILFIILLLQTLIIRAQSPLYITFDNAVYKEAIEIDTVHYHHNIWQVGAPHKSVFTSAQSLPNAIVTDTANPVPPNDTSVFYLKLQAYYSSSGGSGSVSYVGFYYEINKDTGTQIKIEIASDSSTNWVNIDSCFSGLPYQFICPYYWHPDTLNIGWTGFAIQNMYRDNTNSNDSIVFKFSFITDSVVGAFDGWMIDNIQVMYTADFESVPQVTFQHNELTIAPQPAHNLIYINDKKDRSYNIRLINMMGNEVLNQTLRGMSETIDVSRLQTGMYEAVIQDDTGQQYYDKVVVEN